MAENSGEQPKPRGKGRPFPKGTSGNPGGRPKDLGAFREMLRDRLTEKAVRALARHLKPNAVGPEVVRAAVEALAFGWGRPTQSMELSGPGGKPVRLDLTKISDGALDELGAALEAVDGEPGVPDAGDDSGGEGETEPQ